jgi:hypothetical protein
MQLALRVALIAGVVALAAPAASHAQNSRALAIRAEMASVLLQSKRYDEAAREYRVLLAYSPRSYAHRLNLVRALMWGNRPREAERELMVLITQRGRDPELERMLLAARQQLRPSADEAEAWLRDRPQSLEYRRILARSLARERRSSDALAQYDTLIRVRPSPGHFLERAYVHAERRDFDAAERDVNASIQLGATGDAYMLRGDLYRARGSYGAARNAYWNARRLSDEVDLAGAMARLARDERPAVGLLPDVFGDSPGWRASTGTTGDNLGVNLTSASLRRGTWIAGFDASAGAKVRRLAGPSATPLSDGGAFGADVAAARDGSRGRAYGRVRGRLGFLAHPAGDMIPEGGVAAVGYFDAWGFGFDLDVGPAYPELLTIDAFLPSPVNGEQLRQQSSTLTFAGPLGPVDVGASREHTALSDGNARTTLQGLARVRVQPHLALVYSGHAQTFEQPSTLYWSPATYTAHGIGPELSVRQARGLSAALRVLPGLAWTSEYPAGDAVVRASAFQITARGSLAWRGTAWEAGANGSYGQGRSGDYRRFDASVYMSYAP